MGSNRVDKCQLLCYDCHKIKTKSERTILNALLKRGEKRVWASHHTCFNPRCINPNHLKPMTEEDHNDLHKRIGDNHPTNNNNLDFQVVNKHEELVVH